MPTVYPIVPGHEIVGRVTKVGSAVTKFKPGDLAAVGCLVDSDGTCPECRAGLEQFCPNLTLTFNMPDKHLGGVTYGGYSESIVVDQRFVLRVPSNLNLAGAAPLLCSALESQLTRPCAAGASPRARRLEWSALADWATWP
jgi:alcohol dehydrogenase (NADP+)